MTVDELVPSVKKILREERGTALTAYQIYNRLGKMTKAKVWGNYGRSGKRANKHFSSASMIAKAAKKASDGLTWVATDQMYFIVDGEIIKPGSGYAAAYFVK